MCSGRRVLTDRRTSSHFAHTTRSITCFSTHFVFTLITSNSRGVPRYHSVRAVITTITLHASQTLVLWGAAQSVRWFLERVLLLKCHFYRLDENTSRKQLFSRAWIDLPVLPRAVSHYTASCYLWPLRKAGAFSACYRCCFLFTLGRQSALPSIPPCFVGFRNMGE